MAFDNTFQALLGGLGLFLFCDRFHQFANFGGKGGLEGCLGQFEENSKVICGIEGQFSRLVMDLKISTKNLILPL